ARGGPKIFAGEYAAQSDRVVSKENKNNLRTAIAEAAFLTGLERNADVVSMASYAPLFAHVDGWQWTPDLIWVDNLSSYGSANYQVQMLFSTNKGNHVVSALVNSKPLTGQDSLYASAVIDKNTNEAIIKIVNSAASERPTCLAFEGVKKLNAQATVTVLTAESLDKVNTLDLPTAVSPVTRQMALKGKKIDLTMPANSLIVFRVKL